MPLTTSTPIVEDMLRLVLGDGACVNALGMYTLRHLNAIHIGKLAEVSPRRARISSTLTFTCSSSLLVHPFLPVLSSPSLVTHHAPSLCILPCPSSLPSLLTHLYLLILPPCTCLSSLHHPSSPTFTCSSSLLAPPFLPIHSSPTLLAYPPSLCILLSHPLFTIPCKHPCSLLANHSLPVLSSSLITHFYLLILPPCTSLLAYPLFTLPSHQPLLVHPPALHILTSRASLHDPLSPTFTCSSSILARPNVPVLSSLSLLT